MATRTKADRSAAAKKAAATRKRNKAAAEKRDVRIAGREAGDKILEAAKASGSAAEAAVRSIGHLVDAEATKRKSGARR